MKFYQIVSIKIKPNGEAGDEHLQWQGFDYKQALNQKKSAIIGYNSLNVYDKERTKIEPRVYDLEFLKKQPLRHREPLQTRCLRLQVKP